MSDATLDPAELEAIQAAIRESSPVRSAQPDIEPTRLALIADERIAEAARPILMNVANRWVRGAQRALRGSLPGTWQLEVIGAEAIDGVTAKEELRGGWVAACKAPNDTAEIVMAMHGAVIDLAAARRCGASAPTADNGRQPSPISLRLFQPVGNTGLESFCITWREALDQVLEPTSDLALVSRLIDARCVVRVGLSFSGAVAGRIAIYARPETVLPRPLALAAIKAKAARVASALAAVPVELVVELGTLRMELKQLRALDPGQTLPLPGFVDSLVPVYCAGVLKAWGRPVVSRGVLAVQIVSIVHGQGIQS